MVILLAAILGACVGSFCNVLILRMKDERSLGGRSACVSCQATLQPRDLIPILSWIALRGKCRSCRAPIHIQYPAVEVAGAMIGAYAVWRGGDSTFTAVFLLTLLVIAVFDLRWQLVPTVFTVTMAGILAVWKLAAIQDLFAIALGVLVTGGILGAFVWGSKGRWMGEGDPIVGALIGAALAWPLAPLALFCAFILGGSISAVLLLSGKVTRKTAVPFVPFLAFGAVIVYAWGEGILPFLFYAFG